MTCVMCNGPGKKAISKTVNGITTRIPLCDNHYNTYKILPQVEKEKMKEIGMKLTLTRKMMKKN